MILRGVSMLMRPSIEPASDVVAYVSCDVATIAGMAGTSIGSSSAGGGSRPPVRMTPATDGSVRDVCAKSAESRTSARSPGVISSAPSNRRSSRFGTVIAATMTPSASRPSASGPPPISSPSHAARTSAIVGAISRSSAGSTYTGTSAVTPAATASTSVGCTRFATTATTSVPILCVMVSVTETAAWISAAVRRCPETTHSAGRPRLSATRALKASSPVVATSAKSVPTASTASDVSASAR